MQGLILHVVLDKICIYSIKGDKYGKEDQYYACRMI